MANKHLSIELHPLKLQTIIENGATLVQMPLTMQPPTYVNAVHAPNAHRKGFEFYEQLKDGQQEHGRRLGEIFSPYGKRGDYLYVKEEWGTAGTTSQDYMLRATTPDGSPGDLARSQPWQPARTMPKHLARYWLRVTDVAIQRAQSITKEQALADGPTRLPVKDIKGYAPAYLDHLAGNSFCLGARTAFKQLLTAVHGPLVWQNNFWMWVIGVEMVDAPNYERERNEQGFVRQNSSYTIGEALESKQLSAQS